MRTWQQFLETHESDEERNGIDTDHDNERGESAEHKAKVKKAHAETVKFFKARKEGAAKIASEARAKGGPAMLTAWHFAAKAKPYQEVLSAIETGKDKSFYVSKCNNLLHKIRIGRMTEQHFQEVMGELEVWGEALAQLFSAHARS